MIGILGGRFMGLRLRGRRGRWEIEAEGAWEGGKS